MPKRQLHKAQLGDKGSEVNCRGSHVGTPIIHDLSQLSRKYISIQNGSAKWEGGRLWIVEGN